MFRDLQAGYPVMMLDKSTGVTKFRNCTVVSRGEPRFNERAAMAKSQLGTPMVSMEKVVDLALESEGFSQTFVVPENGNMASSPDFVLSCDPAIIMNELRLSMKKSEDHIASNPVHEENIKSCKEIMGMINPQFADSREQSQRLDRLESVVAGFDDKLSMILDKISTPPSPKSK